MLKAIGVTVVLILVYSGINAITSALSPDPVKRDPNGWLVHEISR